MNRFPRSASAPGGEKKKSSVCKASVSQFVTLPRVWVLMITLAWSACETVSRNPEALKSVLKTQVNIWPFQSYCKRWFKTLSLWIRKESGLFEIEVCHCLFLDLTEPTVGLTVCCHGILFVRTVLNCVGTFSSCLPSVL